MHLLAVTEHGHEFSGFGLPLNDDFSGKSLDFDIGSRVEICATSENRAGIVRWIGYLGTTGQRLTVGIEMCFCKWEHHFEKLLNSDPPDQIDEQTTAAATADNATPSPNGTEFTAEETKAAVRKLKNHKAFDTVNRQSLWVILQSTGVPKKIVNLFRELHNKTESDQHFPGGTDGMLNGRRYFSCPLGKGHFVDAALCLPCIMRSPPLPPPVSSVDWQYPFSVPPSSPNSMLSKSSLRKTFGNKECNAVIGTVPPVSSDDVIKICGKFKGIQGHHNSCYLDATLFCMFTFTSVFDSLIYRPQEAEDIRQYNEVQRVLREDIVNPLRTNLFVRADRVMKLRTLLENLGDVSGLTSEEKGYVSTVFTPLFDPEEFLNCLLSQVLKVEPLLKLSSGQDAYFYQLFVEKEEGLILPTVQHLFERSFLTSGIKLKEVPSCLIVQMPRFGKSYKMYEFVMPSLLLDVTDIIEDSPRQCIVCGKLARVECIECMGQCGTGLESTAFCEPCIKTVHTHRTRANHKIKQLSVPSDFVMVQEHCQLPRLYMELFAVVCIATSHYVAFSKCGNGPDAPWCFFDSMADRKGEQHGYNIPEMQPCPELGQWLREEWDHSVLNSPVGRESVPELVKRLFSDAYLCLYQSTDVMMYR
nr:EOG090X03LH [Artemia franciscana]